MTNLGGERVIASRGPFLLLELLQIRQALVALAMETYFAKATSKVRSSDRSDRVKQPSMI